jgi:hypothetical protein
VSTPGRSSANPYLRLPFLFDHERLKHDLNKCLELEWRQHFNEKDYSGEWTGIALRSATGATHDILPRPSCDSYRDTPLLEVCSYFRNVLGSFCCRQEAVRLLRLAPGSRINEHRDRGECYERGTFRVHIPIRTDASVSFRIDGCEVPMKEGECWYANVDLPHSVANNGLHERIHLVIDCERNPWSDEMFRVAGYDFSEEERQRQPDADTRRRMVEELSRMNTDTARRLIEELTRDTHGDT